jgi:hypothetical protein
VQGWWTAVVPAKGAYPDEEAARRAADTGPDLVEGWREVSARYAAVQEEYLRGGGPGAPVWVWWNEEERDTAAALVRRQAHEAVVHCWDARRAVGAGAVEPIPAEPAADGVDEFPEHFLDGPEWAGGPAVLELAATDSGARWWLGTGGVGPCGVGPCGLGRPARLAGGAADARVVGTAERLYLLLWRRLGVEEVTVTGDLAKADALLGWADLT